MRGKSIISRGRSTIGAWNTRALKYRATGRSLVDVLCGAGTRGERERAIGERFEVRASIDRDTYTAGDGGVMSPLFGGLRSRWFAGRKAHKLTDHPRSNSRGLHTAGERISVRPRARSAEWFLPFPSNRLIARTYLTRIKRRNDRTRYEGER